MIFTEV